MNFPGNNVNQIPQNNFNPNIPQSNGASGINQSSGFQGFSPGGANQHIISPQVPQSPNLNNGKALNNSNIGNTSHNSSFNGSGLNSNQGSIPPPGPLMPGVMNSKPGDIPPPTSIPGGAPLAPPFPVGMNTNQGGIPPPGPLMPGVMNSKPGSIPPTPPVPGGIPPPISIPGGMNNKPGGIPPVPGGMNNQLGGGPPAPPGPAIPGVMNSKPGDALPTPPVPGGIPPPMSIPGGMNNQPGGASLAPPGPAIPGVMSSKPGNIPSTLPVPGGIPSPMSIPGGMNNQPGGGPPAPSGPAIPGVMNSKSGDALPTPPVPGIMNNKPGSIPPVPGGMNNQPGVGPPAPPGPAIPGVMNSKSGNIPSTLPVPGGIPSPMPIPGGMNNKPGNIPPPGLTAFTNSKSDLPSDPYSLDSNRNSVSWVPPALSSNHAGASPHVTELNSNQEPFSVPSQNSPGLHQTPITGNTDSLDREKVGKYSSLSVPQYDSLTDNSSTSLQTKDSSAKNADKRDSHPKLVPPSSISDAAHVPRQSATAKELSITSRTRYSFVAPTEDSFSPVDFTKYNSDDNFEFSVQDYDDKTKTNNDSDISNFEMESLFNIKQKIDEIDSLSFDGLEDTLDSLRDRFFQLSFSVYTSVTKSAAALNETVTSLDSCARQVYSCISSKTEDEIKKLSDTPTFEKKEYRPLPRLDFKYESIFRKRHNRILQKSITCDEHIRIGSPEIRFLTYNDFFE